MNVTYTLTNDYDSGFVSTNGGYWANDSVTRSLNVFDLGGGSYCAAINDTGSFVTFAGQSPAGLGTLSAGVKGVVNGGYTSTVFTGTLNPSPAYKTNGNLGTFDLQCNVDCGGAHPSALSYFSSQRGYDFATWGWTYHTAKNGNWTNAATGNSGDIKS